MADERNSEAQRILVVPADLLEAELTGPLFQRKSFEINRVADADAALALVESWQPHLVLFSSALPGMGPSDFCDHLKELAGPPKLVMITDSLLQDWDDPLSAETDAHFTGPFDGNSLTSRIAALLDVRHRTVPRVDTEILAKAVGLSEESSEDQLVNIINLSEVGARLEASAELTVGQMGQLTFVLPDAWRRLSVSCVVRVLTDEILLHFGIEFIGLDGDERQALRDYVESVRTEDER